MTTRNNNSRGYSHGTVSALRVLANCLSHAMLHAKQAETPYGEGYFAGVVSGYKLGIQTMRDFVEPKRMPVPAERYVCHNTNNPNPERL